ncbi:MAG: FKBP-type peptidyl-prolyl cis-trans isomerase N-terminal domain-containing protein [Sphaerochaeta sp.]|nr:FKBP-type peptidyl-prolyl cis-trans isomerase N-terminal domain-containing protein [Sphaerochaeta sp.]
MNKSKIAKISVALLAMALIVPTLFAAGIKESDPQSVTVRIINVDQEGVSPLLTVRTVDNKQFTVKTDKTTASSFPVSGLSAGDYLEVVLDMDKATAIRYITPLVTLGAMDVYISTAEMTSLSTLDERFSYTYGYLLLQSFASQGLFFDTGYYVKGALDGFKASMDKDQQGYYTLDELYANIEEYQNTVWQAQEAPQGFSEGFADIAEVASLAKPEDLTKTFSYTYGYLLAYNMLGQGIELDAELYAQGALDLASNNKTLMNDEEMQTAFAEYQEVVEERYALWLEEVTVTNLEDAEAFLDFNKNNNEGIVVTPSGLQYQVLNASDGPKPTASDTVEVNYQLQMIDGSLIESSYDRGETAHFPVTQVIEGFSEALLNMNVGSVIRTWIHPDLGYGVHGTENILPNSLLVFDIELVGIDK